MSDSFLRPAGTTWAWLPSSPWRRRSTSRHPAGPAPEAPADPDPRRIAGELAMLPAHLRRDIGLPDL